MRIILRWIPGLTWLQIGWSWNGKCEPGHAWMYRGLVRRDTFTLRGRGLVVMAMPKRARIHG